jgi:hypothetical protein
MSWSNFILRLAEIIFIRRSRGLAFLRIGCALWIPVLAAEFSLKLQGKTQFGPIDFSFSTTGDAVQVVSWVAVLIACSLIAVGLIFCFQEWSLEQRKKVIVIEARGLRDWHGAPLMNAVPKSILGTRTQLLPPLSQGLDGNQNLQPDMALRGLTSVPSSLAALVGGKDRQDVTIVAGGLAPVPFLFLLGSMIDDEGPVTLMDWDRHRSVWRQLDEPDDGARFSVTGLDLIPQGTKRVAVCVSVSYANAELGIRAAEPSAPLVRLNLQTLSTSGHFSEAKQSALAEQLLNVLIALEGEGVTEISLFLAIPASLAIRFGKICDKRNLPVIEVNQFERGAFPWALRVPTSHDQQASIVWRQLQDVAA